MSEIEYKKIKKLLLVCRQALNCLPADRISNRKLAAVKRQRAVMQAMGNANAVELIDALLDFAAVYNAGESFPDAEKAAAKVVSRLEGLIKR